MSAPPRSWILELRERLGHGRRRSPREEAGLIAVLVPMFVEEGRLMTVLRLGESLPPDGLRQVALPSRAIDGPAELWGAVAGLAEEELGVAAASVLRLGELSAVPAEERFGLGAVDLLPAVVAIPSYEAPASAESELRSVPLLSIAAPESVQRMRVTLAAQEHEVMVQHAAGLRLWGPVAEVLDDLLSNLGLHH